MEKNKDYYMKQALKEAEKAYSKSKRNKNRYNKTRRNNCNSKSK